MSSRTIEQNEVDVKLIGGNQIAVDMSIAQMNMLFKKHRGRVPANRSEAESFVMQLVYRKLVERGLISKK